VAESLPLLSLRGANIGFGGAPLFSDLSASISKGDRICLVGHNGSGKSTLLKALAGIVEIDAGERFVQPATRIGYLPQEVSFPDDATVVEFVAGDGAAAHHVAAQLDEHKLAGDRRMESLSGGEKRRAALARTLAPSPDILLLDEPTNHLDLPAIEWLETMLHRFPGGWLAVSHDRTFLRNTTQSTLWLTAGRLHRNAGGFGDFESWSERIAAAEDAALNRIKNSLQAEIRYMHRGVTARRKRNQGRLRKLGELRTERAQRLHVETRPKMKQIIGAPGGKLVLEVDGLIKSYDACTIVDGFSTRVLKGDRVGFIGGNGVGKSTLIGIMTGLIEPDGGRVRLAKDLRIAYFDQGRQSLDPTQTPVDILVERGGDTVVVNGHQRHVVAYLSDFLFQEHQVRSTIGSLSGGEQSRLLLARILIQPSNLLVLDEPTNDLDMDTLDILQDRLDEYEGTLLVVSHDREFLDQIVTSVIALEGNGNITEYAGGYTDYLHQRPAPERSQERAPKPQRLIPKRASVERSRAKRMSWRETQDLEALPARITVFEEEISSLEATLNDPDLFAADPVKFEQIATRLAAANADKAAAEELWLELELKRDAASASDDT
jgi:ATP-binding cassette subfamily F protein uup